MTLSDTDIVERRVAETLAGFDRGWCFVALDGKRPTGKGWSKCPPPGRDEVETWARKGNVGLRTGKPSGVVVVDLDAGCDTQGLDLPRTVTVKTGSGGRHLYYRAPDRAIRNSAGKLGKHIDVRGDGGQVVFPGSIHPKTGLPYVWEEGLGPDEVEMAPFPKGIIDRLRSSKGSTAAGGNGTSRYATKALEGEIAKVRSTPNGGRNDQLNKSAFALGQLVGSGALDRDEVEAALRAATDLPQAEARATITSGLDAGVLEPRTAPQGGGGAEPTRTAPHLTDVGNGIRLVRRHGRDLRYCFPLKSWFVGDGTRWAQDTTGELARRAKATVRDLFREAAEIDDSELRDEALKWARRSESIGRIKAMIEAAQSEPGMPITPAGLDSDPWLLAVLNGTIDLRTGELREHRREDMLTKLVPVECDPAAQCPTWVGFLDRIFNSNPTMIAYIQRVVGYGLTGSTREQCFFLLYGTGSNGKSVFLTIVRALLGEYAEQTPASSFMVRRAAEGASNDLAKLRGARFVTAVETEDGQRLSEPIMKQLTGEDPITARFLFQEFFTFDPTFKVALATNHKPTIRGTDHGIWRRVRLIPFTVTIPDEEQDRELASKLREELPGILNWAIEGCSSWLEDGSLHDPEQVLAATQEYRREQDRFADYLDERCIAEQFASVEATALYLDYKQWAESRGERAFSQKRFGEWLGQQGFERTRGGTGRYVWQGLHLRGAVEASR